MEMERMLEINEARRERANDRTFDKWDRWERAAKRWIGELCRDGRPMYYVVLPIGKVKESHSETELAHYLGRNGYL